MREAWKYVRWVVLGALVLVIALMLSKPRRAAPPLTTEARQELSTQFEQKLEKLEQSRASGETGATEKFSPAEVNAGLDQMTSNASSVAGSNDQQPEVRVVAVDFQGDEAVGQFIVKRYGRDIYVTMRGRLSAKDGYANIELTEAKIGNLSVPVSMINPRLQQRLSEPDQREKLKLPDFIADLRVEDGNLVIVEK